MFYALSWIAVTSLLALWSLAAWGLHAVAAWTVSSAGALTGSASGVASLRLPEWLAPWLPPEIVQWMTSMLAGLGPVVDGLLQGTPALAAGLTVLTWVVWGIGAVLLVAVGAAVGPGLYDSLGALLRSLFAVTSTRSMRMNSARSPGGSGSSMRC